MIKNSAVFIVCLFVNGLCANLTTSQVESRSFQFLPAACPNLMVVIDYDGR